LKTEVSLCKRIKCYFVHTTPEEFENAAISAVILELRLRKTRSGKSTDYRDAIAFEMLRFQNVFHPRENKKPAFLNSSGLKSFCEKLRFRDGLVWMVGLTVEIKLRFQISPGNVDASAADSFEYEPLKAIVS